LTYNGLHGVIAQKIEIFDIDAIAIARVIKTFVSATGYAISSAPEQK
jgi:hypothetical protein